MVTFRCFWPRQTIQWLSCWSKPLDFDPTKDPKYLLQNYQKESFQKLNKLARCTSLEYKLCVFLGILLWNKRLVIHGTLILTVMVKNVSFCWNFMNNTHTEIIYTLSMLYNSKQKYEKYWTICVPHIFTYMTHIKHHLRNYS